MGGRRRVCGVLSALIDIDEACQLHGSTYLPQIGTSCSHTLLYAMRRWDFGRRVAGGCLGRIRAVGMYMQVVLAKMGVKACSCYTLRQS